MAHTRRSNHNNRDVPATTPWLNITEAAAYAKRGRRFLRSEVNKGRLRAAVIGGRKEILTRREWLDAFLEDLAQPVLVSRRALR